MPTAPPIHRQTNPGAGFARVAALAVALGIAGVLGLAAWLHPDAAGHGTHTQLGMPQCQWVVLFNKPCPTCGMTTSFALAAHEHLARSFINQPMGAVLAVVSAAVFWGALHITLGGIRVEPLFRGVWNRWTVGLLVACFLGAWVYKIVTWNGA